MTLGQLGLGLRWEFADELLARAPESVDFLELSPENYIGRGGSARRTLERALERYPVVTTRLTMSLGGVEPPEARPPVKRHKTQLHATVQEPHQEGLAWTDTHVLVCERSHGESECTSQMR